MKELIDNPGAASWHKPGSWPTATGNHMEISVVIPALNAAAYLPRLLERIEAQTFPPREIIVVDSSRNSETEEVVRNWQGTIPVLYQRLGFAYPGHARNAGVSLAGGSWIAFLDCRTLPDSDWLQQCSGIAREQDVQFVPGVFITKADSHFKQILLAATYGKVSVISLPGSLVLKEMFNQSGGFVPGARAGEDVEWMDRLSALGVRKAHAASPLLTYEGLPPSLGAAVRKWYVYAVANKNVNIRVYQKFFYGSLLFGASLLFIYNWNSLFAHWRENSIYYVPNITKIFSAIILILYGITQGIIKPLKKNFPLRFLLPFNWIEIVAVRICLDLAKAPGMTIGAVLHLWQQLPFFRNSPKTPTHP